MYNHSVILYSYSCKLFKFTLFLSLLDNKEDGKDDLPDDSDGEADDQAPMETEDREGGTGTRKKEEGQQGDGGNSDSVTEKGLSSRM